MENMGLGAGLGALGFWAFIAAVVIAGIWYAIREREAKHETLRRMIESDKAIDQALMEKLLSLNGGGSKRLDHDLKVSGLIVLFVRARCGVAGVVLSACNPKMCCFPCWALPPSSLVSASVSWLRQNPLNARTKRRTLRRPHCQRRPWHSNFGSSTRLLRQKSGSVGGRFGSQWRSRRVCRTGAAPPVVDS